MPNRKKSAILAVLTTPRHPHGRPWLLALVTKDGEARDLARTAPPDVGTVTVIPTGIDAFPVLAVETQAGIAFQWGHSPKQAWRRLRTDGVKVATIYVFKKPWVSTSGEDEMGLIQHRHFSHDDADGLS